jgi:hypothetical protein
MVCNREILWKQREIIENSYSEGPDKIITNFEMDKAATEL